MNQAEWMERTERMKRMKRMKQKATAEAYLTGNTWSTIRIQRPIAAIEINT
jgi:hypothetical protein